MNHALPEAKAVTAEPQQPARRGSCLCLVPSADSLTFVQRLTLEDLINVRRLLEDNNKKNVSVCLPFGLVCISCWTAWLRQPGWFTLLVAWRQGQVTDRGGLARRARVRARGAASASAGGPHQRARASPCCCWRELLLMMMMVVMVVVESAGRLLKLMVG